MSEDVQIERPLLHSAILEAVKGRIATVSIATQLADATDCYAKGSPGDAYAKNVCSIDLTGAERVLPPFTRQVFGAAGEVQR